MYGLRDNAEATVEPVSKRYNSWALALCAAAGILYNSWPLGYMLDNPTAHHNLASDLDMVGHPYYWLFILCDILTAACLITVAIALYFKPWALWHPTTRNIVAAGLLLFGLFTGVAALAPAPCTATNLLSCREVNGVRLGLDTLTSSIAALGLFISLAYLCIEAGRNLKKTFLARLTQTTLIAWVTSGLIFAGLALANKNAQFAQYIFLIICGIALSIIGLNIAVALRPD